MENLQERIAETSGWIQAVKDEMGQVLVGQERLVDRLLIGLLCNGHILLEGVPGLAKTLAVKALSGSLRRLVRPLPVHARPAARRPGGHHGLSPAGDHASNPNSARFSTT